MSFDVIEQLRDVIVNDTALNDFIQNRYSKALTTFHGPKQLDNIKNCPALIFVPILDEEPLDQSTAIKKKGTLRIIVVINEKGVDENNVFDGERYKAEIASILVRILNDNLILNVTFNQVRTFHETPEQHPFYSCDLIVSYNEF